MKRIFDLCFAFVAIVILLPVLLVVALAIKLDSVGPVFFLQTRIGLGGRSFRIFKFRSMVNNAEELGGYSTAYGDARVTHVGRFIRKTSLDELPQILNVLKGDMSWVGPRPDVPEQRIEYMDQEWETRHSVRPGITGLAQATLRSLATWEQRKAIDLDYVERHSFWLDLRILLLTARHILGRAGN